MKILITGNRGFVGVELQKFLKNGRYEVIGFDMLDGFDIRERNQLERIVKEQKPSCLVHLAAVARFTDADLNPLLAFEVNTLGTKNVVEVCSKYQLPLVHIGTGSEYMPVEQNMPITEEFPIRGNSVYGVSKTIASLYVQECTAPWIILRLGHLLGAKKVGHGLLGGFLSRINKGMPPIIFGDGSNSNDLCHVFDVAQAIHKAIGAPSQMWRQAYNIGTGIETRTEDAAKMICEVFDWKGEIEKREARTVDPSRFVFDINKAKNLLGYDPKYDFRSSLLQIKEELNNKE